MTVAQRVTFVSVREYLADEELSPIKREYVGGAIFPRPDTNNRHNLIAGNTLGSMHLRLRGERCQVFSSDTKIRMRLPHQVRFYYPDASVVCQPNPPDDSFQDDPAVIVEVASRSTRRVDEGEKKDAYLTIPSLTVYLIVEQDSPSVVAYRRTEQAFVGAKVTRTCPT